MILSLPEGYAPPENARPGEPFEAVATLKVNDDGSFELLMIDGAELAKEKEEAAEEEDEMAKFAAKIPLPWEQEQKPVPSY